MLRERDSVSLPFLSKNINYKIEKKKDGGREHTRRPEQGAESERRRAGEERGRGREGVMEEMYPHDNITNRRAFFTLRVVHLNLY